MLTHPDDFLELRERHYERFFGKVMRPVMHSADTNSPHIDIYQFPPTKDRRYWTLVTSGMSNSRQPEKANSPELVSPRTEILMYVLEPKEWMMSVLKGLAEFPFEKHTWLHWWHTLPNGMPMTETPSLLSAYIFLPPSMERCEFEDFMLHGEKVDFLWMVPITESERQFAVKYGSEALQERLRLLRTWPVVDESRSSVA